jgi:hypothetical protein
LSNPYEPPRTVDDSAGSYGDFAKLLQRGFLFRRIALTRPVEATFQYNGWNFLQRIHINEQLVWKRVSWVVIHRSASFQLPASIDPRQAACEVRIVFTRGLLIHRFTLLMEGTIVYDEWN